MAFLIHCIKEKQSDDNQIDLIALHESSSQVRQFLIDNKILLLSISEYNSRPEDYADTWANIKRWDTSMMVVSKGENIQTVAEYLLDIGLDVLDINSYSMPQNQKIIEDILRTSREKVQEAKLIEQKERKEQKDRQKQIYWDPRLDDVKAVSVWIFERIPAVMEMVQWQVSAAEIRKINTLVESLKKLKMGNNYESIRDVAHHVLLWMREVEKHFSNALQAQKQYLIPWSLMTDVDLERQEMLLLYAQKKKLLGIDIASLDDQFLIGGRFSIFLYFFVKDIVNTFSSPATVLYHLYHTILLGLWFLLGSAGVFMIYTLFSPAGYPIDLLRPHFVSLGTLWLLLWIGSLFAKKHLGYMLLIFVCVFGGYRLLLKFLIATFALTI